MGKRTYFYINDNDLLQLLQFFTDNNLLYHTTGNMRAIDAVENEFRITCEGADENDPGCIMLWTSRGYPEEIDEALIRFDDEAESDESLKKAYKKIKKYIQTNYKMSQTKEFYFAPGIYKDWLDKKVRLPVLLEFEEYSVDVNEFDIRSFIDDIIGRGYIVRTNCAKLRVMDEVDINAESMVIYTPKSKLCTTIINRNFIRYLNDSECIFLYRTKRKNRRVFLFMLDKRITESDSKELIDLFRALSYN